MSPSIKQDRIESAPFFFLSLSLSPFSKGVGSLELDLDDTLAIFCLSVLEV